jgi:hypothetical protein
MDHNVEEDWRTKVSCINVSHYVEVVELPL